MIDPWPPAALGPPSRPIVWNVDLGLGGAALRAAQRVLSSEEKRRHARFVRPVDRDRYAASHAALRFILASPVLTGQVIALDGGQRFLNLARDVQFLEP